MAPKFEPDEIPRQVRATYYRSLSLTVGTTDEKQRKARARVSAYSRALACGLASAKVDTLIDQIEQEAFPPKAREVGSHP